MAGVDHTFEGTPTQAPLRAAGQALFAPELASLGWQPQPGESSETSKLRGALVNRLAALGHAGTLAAAHQRFAAALAADTASVPGSLRGSILQAVGHQADAAEFEALWAALHQTESQEDRWLLLEALCAGTDAARAQRLLDESLSGRLPTDVSFGLLGQLGAVGALRLQVYEFAVEHWPALARLGGEGAFGGRNWLLPNIAWWSSDVALAARLLQDQQRLAGATGESTAQRVAAGMGVRARLRERESTGLADALAGWPPRE